MRRVVRRVAVETGPGAVTTRDPALLNALLRLPRSYRRTLLLHDGVGLGLPATAAEIEASTPATAGRLTHAREELLRHLPELRRVPPDRLGAVLHHRLGALAVAQPVRTRAAELVRSGSEHTTKVLVRGSLGFTALITACTVLSLLTSSAADRPIFSPARPVSTAPVTPTATPPDARAPAPAASPAPAPPARTTPAPGPEPTSLTPAPVP